MESFRSDQILGLHPKSQRTLPKKGWIDLRTSLLKYGVPGTERVPHFWNQTSGTVPCSGATVWTALVPCDFCPMLCRAWLLQLSALSVTFVPANFVGVLLASHPECSRRVDCSFLAGCVSHHGFRPALVVRHFRNQSQASLGKDARPRAVVAVMNQGRGGGNST